MSESCDNPVLRTGSIRKAAATIEKRLLTEVETAQLLGVSSRTVWGLANTGILPVVRVGRAKRYDRHDIEMLIQQSKTTKMPARRDIGNAIYCEDNGNDREIVDGPTDPS